MSATFEVLPEDLDLVYVETIEPLYFERTTAVAKPRAFIVGGQPGCGKGRVLSDVKKSFQDFNAVVVNTDDLRAYHPKFEEIIRLDDKVSAQHTHEAASAWNHRLLMRSIIILEGVLKDSTKLLSTIAKLKEAGYEVIVRLIAAHERFSKWGIHKRYEGEKKIRLHGRFVPLQYHDQCYEALPHSATAVEEQGIADLIEIFTRDGNLIYSNENKAGIWKEKPNAASVILDERSTTLAGEKLKEYVNGWMSVIDDMRERGASHNELDAVITLAKRLIDSC
jgi:hypothetical protein